MFPLLCFSDIHDRMELKRFWWAMSTKRLHELGVKVYDSHPRSSIRIYDNRGNRSNLRHLGDGANLVADAPDRNNCHDQFDDDNGSVEDDDDIISTVQSRGSVDSRRYNGSSGPRSRISSTQPSDLIASEKVASITRKLFFDQEFETEQETQYTRSLQEDLGSSENDLTPNESILYNQGSDIYAQSQHSSIPVDGQHLRESQVSQISERSTRIGNERGSIQSNQRKGSNISRVVEGERNLGHSTISMTASSASIGARYSENRDQPQYFVDEDLENDVNADPVSRLDPAGRLSDTSSRVIDKALSFAASAMSRKTRLSQNSDKSISSEKHESFGIEHNDDLETERNDEHTSRRDTGQEYRMTSRARKLSVPPSNTPWLENKKNESTCMQEIREKVKYIAALAERDDCTRASRPSKVTSPRPSNVISDPTEKSEPTFNQNIPNQLQHNAKFQEAISFLSDKCKADYIIAEVENLKRMESCMKSPNAHQRAASVRNQTATYQSLLDDTSKLDYVRESLKKISDYVQDSFTPLHSCKPQHGGSYHHDQKPNPNQSSPHLSNYQSFLTAPTHVSHPLSQPSYPLNLYPMNNASYVSNQSCLQQQHNVQPYQQDCRLVDPPNRQARSHITSDSSYATADTHCSNGRSHHSLKLPDLSVRCGPPIHHSPDESIPPREQDDISQGSHDAAPRSCSRSANSRSSSCCSSTTSATFAVVVVVLLVVAIFLSSFILSFEFLKSRPSLNVKGNVTKHVKPSVEPVQKTCTHKTHRTLYRKPLIKTLAQKKSETDLNADTIEFRLLMQKVASYLKDTIDGGDSNYDKEHKTKKHEKSMLAYNKIKQECNASKVAEHEGNSQNIENLDTKDQKTKNNKVNDQKPTIPNSAQYEHDENEKENTSDTTEHSSKVEDNITNIEPDCNDEEHADTNQDTTVCEHRTLELNLEDDKIADTVGSDPSPHYTHEQSLVQLDMKTPSQAENTTTEEHTQEEGSSEDQCEKCEDEEPKTEDEGDRNCDNQEVKVKRDCWWLESIFKRDCFYRRNACGRTCCS